MTTIPKPLLFQVLLGCTFVDTLPQHIRRGATFRMVRKDGEPFLAAARLIPHMVDHGVYIASDHGSESGVPFDAMPEVVEMVAPVIDLGGD